MSKSKGQQWSRTLSSPLNGEGVLPGDSRWPLLLLKLKSSKQDLGDGLLEASKTLRNKGDADLSRQIRSRKRHWRSGTDLSTTHAQPPQKENITTLNDSYTHRKTQKDMKQNKTQVNRL